MSLISSNHFSYPYQLFCSPAWPKILSYLQLSDLDSFSQADVWLKRLVDAFIQDGNYLLINKDTIRWPIRNGLPLIYLYAKYAFRSKKLVVHDIPEEHLRMILETFTCLSALVVRNMKFGLYYKETYTPTLHKLSLIGNRFYTDNALYDFQLWDNVSPLEVLYLEGNDSICLPDLPRLKSLTVINQAIAQGAFPCPRLQRLTIDYFFKVPYHTIEAFGDLEYLSVLRSVAAPEKDMIDRLQLKRVDLLHTFTVPTEQNLILRLNDDCLLHFKQFVCKYYDWHALLQTNTRFLRLGCDVLVIKNDFDADFVQRIANSVKNLIIQGVLDQNLCCMLPHFTNLKVLDLFYITHREANFTAYIPNGLQKLVLAYDGFFAEEDQLMQLFRRLSPTLKALNMDTLYATLNETREVQGLAELRNIEEFTCTSLTPTKEFVEFLRFNEPHLQVLELIIIRQSSEQGQMWNVIRNMKNLKRFSVAGISLISFDVIGHAAETSFPNLEDLSLTSCGSIDEVLPFLEVLDGSKITALKVEGEMPMELLLPKLPRLQKLQNLTVDSVDYYTLDLVKALPELRSVNSISPAESMGVVCEYLAKNNRTLYFNDVLVQNQFIV